MIEVAVIVLLGFSLISSIIIIFDFKNKLKKYKSEVDDIVKSYDKPIRRGYYTKDLSVSNDDIEFQSMVYVNEIDRFTNNQSKIEIYKIEHGVNSTKVSIDAVEVFIKDDFKSIVETNSITWLESEANIQRDRKNKLNKLKSIFNKN